MDITDLSPFSECVKFGRPVLANTQGTTFQGPWLMY